MWIHCSSAKNLTAQSHLLTPSSRQLWAIWKSGSEEVKGSVHPTPQGNTSLWIWGGCPRFPQAMSVGVGVKWLVHKGNWALGKIDCRFLQLLRPLNGMLLLYLSGVPEIIVFIFCFVCFVLFCLVLVCFVLFCVFFLCVCVWGGGGGKINVCPLHLSSYHL